MAFADLKNDYVFRRIFGTDPALLRRLLNDLLERKDAQTIEQIEYLPLGQLPRVEGAKLSILDVRCHDRTGATFLVNIQLLHHSGFLNRAVYNACTADPGQLQEGDSYPKLPDVVAISICEFELWPDATQDSKNLPRVPMLSRWNMTERDSKNDGLVQVQYAFVELPKMPERHPEQIAQLENADLWAWLFLHAPQLAEVPQSLASGPYGEALELANKAKFTTIELNTYKRVSDEIRQVLEISNARWAEGRRAGRLEGLLTAKRETLLVRLARLGIAITDDDRARIEACAVPATLDRWIESAFAAKTAAEVLL
jgi:predicted transposase/invertase (TIGR01784 family)